MTVRWNTEGAARLRGVGSYEGHVQPNALQVMTLSADASTAAIASGPALEVIDLRAGALAFSTVKGKPVQAALQASRDGGVLAGFAGIAEKTKRVVCYTRGAKGHRAARLELALSVGPNTFTGEPNLALDAAGARGVTVQRTEAIVFDTTKGHVLATMSLGALAVRGGPTPSGAWRLARDGRLWTVHPTDGGSELVCRSLETGEVLTTRGFDRGVVIEDESAGGRLALLAPGSPWAQRDPRATAIVVDAAGDELARVDATDGALRFAGEDRLWNIPPRQLSIFALAHEEARRLDLAGGPPLAMPGAAAVARVTRHGSLAFAVVDDTLLVSDGRALWELEPGGAIRAVHVCAAVAEPARRVHLAHVGDRVLLVADRDGAIRAGATASPCTVVSVFERA